MTDKKSYYITTPIYYVNDVPHIGHAYTSLACDVLARFKRLDGIDTFFLTGTDEHGQKVLQAAEKSGVTAQEFVDKISENHRALPSLMNFSNDDFIRTTERRHKKAAQALWQKLVDAGDIYLDTYEGWYAIRDEAYYDESELSEDAEGNKIAPSGALCEWRNEESYFFRLSAWQDRLIDFFDANPEFVQPDTRFNEVKGFVRGGLRDISISRTSFDWGVPVPGDDKHVMYVWIDALTNYLTAVGYPDEDAAAFKKFWPADLHMVGKDILRFHAVYWPAFLMSAGLPVAKKIFAHGWWTIEGQKMSKSLGNAIAPQELVDRYGLDQARYALLRNVPFGKDGDFNHEQVVATINADLANGLGNLCQRALSMIAKNCDGRVPEHADFTKNDEALLDRAYGVLKTIRPLYDEQAFSRVLETLWVLISEADSYVDTQAPWKLRKEDPERMATVLYVLAETIRVLGILVQPMMPSSAGRILDQVSVSKDQRDFHFLDGDSSLQSGTTLPTPVGVFPRYILEETDR